MEVDFTLLLWQPRHIDQAAEALLDAAPVREEVISPLRLICDVGHGDTLRRATHHHVRGVHGNVFHILGHPHLKSGRDCGHDFVGQPAGTTAAMIVMIHPIHREKMKRLLVALLSSGDE